MFCHTYHRRQAFASPSLPADWLAAQVIRRACEDIRTTPATLPLWAYRLAQHVRRGKLQYQDVWSRLHDAAWEGGTSEAAINRCLYRTFARAQMLQCPPPALEQLAMGGLQ
jgi:hypothetical protein